MNMGKTPLPPRPSRSPKVAWRSARQKRMPSIVVDDCLEPQPSVTTANLTAATSLSAHSSIEVDERPRSSSAGQVSVSPEEPACSKPGPSMIRAGSCGDPPAVSNVESEKKSNSRAATSGGGKAPSLPSTPDLRHHNRLVTRRIRKEESAEGEFVKLNQYKIFRDIGQGSYGIVKLAYNEQDKNHYAMKILDKNKLTKKFAFFRRPPPRKNKTRDIQVPDPVGQVHKEIAILKKLSHPNVVKLVEVLDDDSDKYLYMVFEYVEHGSVLEIPTCEPLDEDLAWRYFRDTLKGLEYLHFQKIVHRDIKPSNILLSDTGHVKIADFGVSSEFEGIDAFLTGTAGTPAFMAPEALIEDACHFYSGRAQDIWSLGITLYSFAYGQVPFWDPYIIALHKKIKTEPLVFPENVTISDQMKTLIRGMLSKDPGFRLMLPEIKIHPWVTKNGAFKLPAESENCELVTVTEDEIRNSVRVIPRLAKIQRSDEKRNNLVSLKARVNPLHSYAILLGIFYAFYACAMHLTGINFMHCKINFMISYSFAPYSKPLPEMKNCAHWGGGHRNPGRT